MKQPDEVLHGEPHTDRIGNLEAELAQTRADLLEAKGSILALQGSVRDMGNLALQMIQTTRELAVEFGKLSAHATHDESYRADFVAVFCPYCVPKEGL